MKRKRSILKLKKVTIVSINTQHSIIGASTDDPLSNARKGCASHVGGGD